MISEVLLSNQFKKIEDTPKVKVFAAGHIFIDGEIKEGYELVKYILKIISSEINHIELFKKFDGHYSIVVCNNRKLTLFVDKIRSFPLFYSINDNQICISDKTSSLLSKINETTIDELSHAELMSTGYITRDRTLYKEIKQVECGQYIEFIMGEKPLIINKKFHFQYRNEYLEPSKRKEAFLKEIDIAYSKSFKKLIDFANGNLIVVPLSGGIDSRQIVYMLHKYNYKNVLCYTYGKKNNKEAIVSKRIAERCNYKWKLIPFSRQMWNDFIRSKELMDFQEYSGNHNTLSHFQDYFAVKKLQESIPKNSIFVPGHTGDLITGYQVAQLDKVIKSSTIFSKDLLIDEIYRVHYSLGKNTMKVKKELKELIGSSILPLKNLQQFSQEYDCWDYNERQSKYNVNSVRVYDYFGFKWTLPFFYNDILDFSLSVPIEIRYNRKLLLEYLNGKFLFEDILNEKRKTSFLSNVLPISLKRKLSTLKNIYEKFIKIILDYYTHPLQWYGIFDNYYKYLIFSFKNFGHYNMSLRFLIKINKIINEKK